MPGGRFALPVQIRRFGIRGYYGHDNSKACWILSLYSAAELATSLP